MLCRGQQKIADMTANQVDTYIHVHPDDGRNNKRALNFAVIYFEIIMADDSFTVLATR